MQCPYCNAEMTEGFIQSARGIFFGIKKHKLSFIANDKEIPLANGWNGSYVKSNHCPNCKKITIDY